MDKSWIGMPRTTTKYLVGLNQFLNFAFTNGAIGDRIKCPCPRCGFVKWETRRVVFNHLMDKPFPQNYVTWIMHGEIDMLQNFRNIEVVQDTVPLRNPIELPVYETFQESTYESFDEGLSHAVEEEEMLNDTPYSNDKDFFELLRDGSEELYEGSKYSKLEFLLKLYHIKCSSGLSDKGMEMMLDLLRDAFEFAKIPNSFYEAKKTIKTLALDYIKIDACPNDCMLYWGDDANEETFKHCHISRWKPNKKSTSKHVLYKKKKQKKIPAKILRYFPLKSRLQRLFMCSKIAEHTRWHAKDSNRDGIIRHPRDGEAWKRWNTNVHADGSILNTFNYLKENGLQGLIHIWPRPTAVAGKIIICYPLFEAALQILLPGKRVEGTISPTGHRPVYKANGVAAYTVTLITYLSL